MPLRALPQKFPHQSPHSSKPQDIPLAQVYRLKAGIAQAFYRLGMTYGAIADAPKTCETLRQADQLSTEVEAVQKIERAFRHL